MAVQLLLSKILFLAHTLPSIAKQCVVRCFAPSTKHCREGVIFLAKESSSRPFPEQLNGTPNPFRSVCASILSPNLYASCPPAMREVFCWSSACSRCVIVIKRQIQSDRHCLFFNTGVCVRVCVNVMKWPRTVSIFAAMITIAVGGRPEMSRHCHRRARTSSNRVDMRAVSKGCVLLAADHHASQGKINRTMTSSLGRLSMFRSAGFITLLLLLLLAEVWDTVTEGTKLKLGQGEARNADKWTPSMGDTRKRV